jgi:hypothetical protein
MLAGRTGGAYTRCPAGFVGWAQGQGDAWMARRNANGVRRDKSALPDKPCAHCQRPFSWRRKWARDWESVRFCSDRCRAAARDSRGAAGTDTAVAARLPPKT